MVLFNYSTKELTAKVVYYGPGLCGKTTNLQYIHQSLPGNVKGKMLSLATKTDRTLFFDFLPIDLGKIRGMQTRVQLYTVPGQVFYNETRKLVLKGADGIVFVADSQQQMLKANVESFRNLEDNLRAHGMDLSEMPHIIQFNKRDLPKLASLEEMNEAINKYNAPFYESVATTGVGVQDSLKAITKLVLLHLTHKYDPKARPAQARPAARAVAPRRAASVAPSPPRSIPLADTGAATVRIPLSAPEPPPAAPRAAVATGLPTDRAAETHPGVSPVAEQAAVSIGIEDDNFAIDEAMAAVEQDFGVDTSDGGVLGGSTVEDAIASVEQSLEQDKTAVDPPVGSGLEAAMAAVETQMAEEESDVAAPVVETPPLETADPSPSPAPAFEVNHGDPAAPAPVADVASVLGEVESFVEKVATELPPPAPSPEFVSAPAEPQDLAPSFEPAPIDVAVPEVSFEDVLPIESAPPVTSESDSAPVVPMAVEAAEPSPFEIDHEADPDWMDLDGEAGNEPESALEVDMGLAGVSIDEQPHVDPSTGAESFETAEGATETEPSGSDESTVSLTEAVPDSDLFEDPDLDIANLVSGEERVVMVPVELGDARTGLRRFKLSIRLRLDPTD